MQKIRLQVFRFPGLICKCCIFPLYRGARNFNLKLFQYDINLCFYIHSGLHAFSHKNSTVFMYTGMFLTWSAQGQDCAAHNMSCIIRKLTFCTCENKDTYQLRGNREADQRLCFGYMASTKPLLPKSKISSL